MSFYARAMGVSAGSHFIFPRQLFADEEDVFAIAEALNSAASRLDVDLAEPSQTFAYWVNAVAENELAPSLGAQLGDIAATGRPADISIQGYRPGGAFSGGWFASRTAYISPNVETIQRTRAFLQDMADCGLNRWGVLKAFVRILSGYTVHCAEHGGYPERPWCFIAVDY